MYSVVALAAQHEFLPRRRVPFSHREQPNHSDEQVHDASLCSLGSLEPLELYLRSVNVLCFGDRF